MRAPAKPFATYKWRWLSVTPSEGLLEAPVFLGVLRALRKHEGDAYSSIGLHDDLRRVQLETETGINLARTPERNLFRNSGQYWRGTGLLVPKTGEIELTALGHQVANAQITTDEFAALMVRDTVLPNPLTYSEGEMANWRDAGLRIKPFELILTVMDHLSKINGMRSAYLTANELIKILIPLAGENAEPSRIAATILSHRAGRLSVANFPDCAPEANDKRLAREFLLFLDNFGICQREEGDDRYNEKFWLEESAFLEISVGEEVSFLEDFDRVDEAISKSRNSPIPLLIERRRVSSFVLRRPAQGRFRREVLSAARSRCIITGEDTPDVIEAAHIIPVSNGGDDLVGNGLCMRMDIHRLYDNGKIRITPDGALVLNDQIADAVSYRRLPDKVTFPQEVRIENIEWRSRYL